jgi:hypothetical protein
MKIDDWENSFKLNVNRIPEFDIRGTAYRVTELYSNYARLCKNTVDLLKKYDKGYNSPEDRLNKIEDDLKFRDLGKIKNLHKFSYLID